MREQTGVKKVCVSARCARGGWLGGKGISFQFISCGYLFRRLAVIGQILDVCLETLEVAIVFQLRERCLCSSSGCLIICTVNSEVSLLFVEVGWLLRQESGQLCCVHENQGIVAF